VDRGIEFLNKGFLIRQALMGGTEVFNTSAFNSQISKQFHRWRPFLRYQYVNSSPQNLFYDDVGLRFGPSVGTRYDTTTTWRSKPSSTTRRDEGFLA
jgi:hypothetical protein